MTLCYIDTETTGLDPRIHQPYEVCWWIEGLPEPMTRWLDHDLTHADPKALEIGNYWMRSAHSEMARRGPCSIEPMELAGCLSGVTLVGSNPAFDAAMLTRFIGTPVWHHRMIDISNVAMTIFDWDAPKGLASVRVELEEHGYDIPIPDHTSEGDVRATRACYEALREIRSEGLT